MIYSSKLFIFSVLLHLFILTFLFSFPDIPSHHWARESVLYLQKLGVISENKYFRGNDPAKRAFVFELIYSLVVERKSNLPLGKKLQKLHSLGLIKGIPGQGFAEKNNLRRYELAVLLRRIILKTNMVFKQLTPKNIYFSDIPSHHWAKASVYFIAKKGLIRGYPDRTFRGNKFVSRYEIAVIFKRLFSKLENMHYEVSKDNFLARLIAICEDYRHEKRKYSLGRWDCSLFVQRVFEKLGIQFPRTTKRQSKVGVRVSFSKLQPGDLVFFDFVRKKPTSPTHVGIYVGNYQGIKKAFFHNSTKVKHVVLADLDQHWAKSRFLYGVRIKGR